MDEKSSKTHTQKKETSSLDMIAEENSAAANNINNINAASEPKTAHNTEEKEKLTVSGFIFVSAEDAELARQELIKIDYLEKRMNYHLPENILAVYNKVLENKMLRTPPGIEYLNKMRNHLLKTGIDAERIAPIPIYHNFAPKISGETTEGIARQRIERRLKKEKTETAKLKSRFQISVAVCLLFAVLISVMFYITLSSDNPNILNYENALLNKYAAWEQELREREILIREKEHEYNIR